MSTPSVENHPPSSTSPGNAQSPKDQGTATWSTGTVSGAEGSVKSLSEPLRSEPGVEPGLLDVEVRQVSSNQAGHAREEGEVSLSLSQSQAVLGRVLHRNAIVGSSSDSSPPPTSAATPQSLRLRSFPPSPSSTPAPTSPTPAARSSSPSSAPLVPSAPQAPAGPSDSTPPPATLLPDPLRLPGLSRQTLSAPHPRPSHSFPPPGPVTTLPSAPATPPTALLKGLLLGLGSPSFRLLVLASSPCKLKLESSLYCCTPFHLELYLDNLQRSSFHRLAVGYSLSLLWILAPALGLLLSLSQALSLLADCIAPLSTDPERLRQKMEPFSSPTFLPESSASSSSPSSQSRGAVQHRVTAAQVIGSTTGVSTLLPNHAYRSTNHHHHVQQHHNDHNHDNNVGSSNNGPRNSRLPPVQEGPHVSSASWQTHESSRAPLYEQPPTLDPSTHDYEEDEALDGDEDRQSEEGSEGEPGHHDMEFWLQRCSICFDARLDFCLEYCRDQFCRSCFQRYVKEVVGNSWGLDVTKIKCPVCQDVIAVSEWTKYVDQSTLAQYHQFNQPYRSFSRFCNECEHELVVSTVNQAAIGLPASSFLPLFDKVLVDLKALLTRAGLNLDEPIATLSPSPVPTVSQNQPPPKASKQRRGNFSRDEAARKIVQKFTDDYQSYCGLNQGTQQSLPSRAQSYLSSLASRALGATFTPSTFPLSANSAPSKPLQPLQTDSSSSASEVQALGIAHQIVGTPMQRKQYCSRMGGVLEIYRPLITSLLELFQLWQKEYDDEASRPSIETRNDGLVHMIGSVSSEQPPTSQNDLQDMRDTMDHQASTTETNMDTITNASDTGRRVSISTTRPRQSPKTTQAARPRVVTRAESRRQVEIKRSLVQLSKQLSSIETRPEQWKELQFLHVRWLRWDFCNNCNHELCLQCGESSHHETKDCFGYMRSLISKDGTKGSHRTRLSNASSRQPSATQPHGKSTNKGKGPLDLDMSTIQWKLANTNPCPNCCILIHRDDGCNKVDCMLCGYRFCWICREPWGAACGFFKCGRRTVVDSEPNIDSMSDEPMDEDVVAGDSPSEEASQDQADSSIPRQDRRRRRSEDLLVSEKPEIGVPNVFVIHTKRSRA